MPRRLSTTLAHALVILSFFAQGFIFGPSIQKEPQVSPPAGAYPCAGLLYDFDGGAQGWAPASKKDGALEFSRATDVPVGKGSLSLTLDLDPKRPNHSAEFLVNLSKNPPACAGAAAPRSMLWAPGSVLSVWIWAPKGTLGDPGSSNGVHLFAVDASERKLYGAWQSIREEAWFEVTLRLDAQETPACGSKTGGFDPTHIVKIGLNIGANTGADHPIQGTLRLAGVSIQPSELPALPSDHAYTFDSASAREVLPQWARRNQSWQAEAFTGLNVQEGALVADASFIPAGGDAARKGVISLISTPPLDLSFQKESEIVFRVDIGFESSAEQKVHCPFGLTLWLYDEGKKSWYTSAYENVGSTYWSRVAFPLSALRSQAYPDQAIDLSRIGELALQVWGNSDYQGKIRFDNIALGGVTPRQSFDGTKDPSQDEFITRTGSHFQLGDQRFRFLGTNAEYLPFVSNAIVADVLDRAQSLGLRVIRTWGFGDGCEDNHLADCQERSHFFQPAPGVYNESAFEHFDRILLEARQRGLRLIVPLVNNWPEYGGIPQYVCWQEAYNPTHDPNCSTRLMAPKFHDMFYSDPAIKSLYREYVQHFVNHVNTFTGIAYKDDPTIMAWELINEPRAPSDPSGETLHAWIVEMSTYLAALAPRQLVGTGEEGWYILSQPAAYKFNGWQTFPNNYWHYGVNWQPDRCTESWGSNGVDFLSDHSSAPQTVTWQETVGPNEKNDSDLLSIQRRGVPDVDYTTMHLYPSPEGTNLPMAPYCAVAGLNSLCATKTDKTDGFVGKSNQAREWISQHVQTSHKVLNKPFVLEEFNFPLLPAEGADPQSTTFQVTARERAVLFSQYLDMAHNLDVDGVMFWDLGYTGFADQPWLEVPSLTKWNRLGSDTQAESAGIQLDYDPAQGLEEARMALPDPQVDWLRANGNRVFVDLQNNGDARSVIFWVRLSDGQNPRSQEYTLTPGKNHILLDALFQRLKQEPSPDQCKLPELEPPHITGMVVTLRGYTAKGSASFDFHTVFNNQYVIYPGDPVEDVIQIAAPHWQPGK